MLSNLLYSSLSNAIEHLVRLDMSNEALLMSVLFSAAGSVLLAKFTGTIGHLTISPEFFGPLYRRWLHQYPACWR